MSAWALSNSLLFPPRPLPDLFAGGVLLFALQIYDIQKIIDPINAPQNKKHFNG
jgi:hypothetical protein